MAGEIQLNSVSLATESGGTVTLNSSTDIKGCINASGSAPIYACRAWINFDGTSASIGTGRANGNVSGVTDNGTGQYTVTFATAMDDANYSAVVSGTRGSAAAAATTQLDNTSYLSTSCKIGNSTDSGTMVDGSIMTLAVFR